MQTNTKNSSRKGLDFGWLGLALALLGLVVVGIVFLVRRYREKKGQNPSGNDNDFVIDEESSSNIDKAKQKVIFSQIAESARSLGFGDDAALAIAGQSAHETGRWKSDLAQMYWNIFGMKDGGAGQNIQSGSARGFATYQNWEQSLQDYYEWCKAKGYPFEENLTVEQHLQWLKSKKYFEDSLANYKTSVLSLINELK